MKEMPMNRILVVAGLWLLGMACACGTPQEVANIEAAEDMEETAGNERMMVQSEEGGEAGGGYLMPPNAEEDVEMQNEPYPE